MYDNVGADNARDIKWEVTDRALSRTRDVLPQKIINFRSRQYVIILSDVFLSQLFIAMLHFLR